MKIIIIFDVFQLHAAISNQVDPEELGLGLGSGLLNNLKQTVVTLASNAGVLNTVQAAAQAVLQSGWSVLLPTAEERARALSSLLPNAGQCMNSVLGKLLILFILYLLSYWLVYIKKHLLRKCKK